MNLDTSSLAQPLRNFLMQPLAAPAENRAASPWIVRSGLATLNRDEGSTHSLLRLWRRRVQALPDAPCIPGIRQPLQRLCAVLEAVRRFSRSDGAA